VGDLTVPKTMRKLSEAFGSSTSRPRSAAPIRRRIGSALPATRRGRGPVAAAQQLAAYAGGGGRLETADRGLGRRHGDFPDPTRISLPVCEAQA
jgi:hypothetical protein